MGYDAGLGNKPYYQINKPWGLNTGGINAVGAVNTQPQYTGESTGGLVGFSLTNKHGTSNQSQPIPGHDINYVARTLDLLG